jgi:hypothetical protein
MCANIFFGGGRKRIKHVKSKSLDCSHSQKQIIRTFIFGHGYRYLASVFIRIPQPHRHFDPIDVVLSCAVFKAARKILMWNSNLCAIRAWVSYTVRVRVRVRDSGHQPVHEGGNYDSATRDSGRLCADQLHACKLAPLSSRMDTCSASKTPISVHLFENVPDSV